MVNHQINGGRIPITLEGREVFLEPSLEAAVEISQINGGLAGAVQRCNNFDFETICKIIGAGIKVDGKRLSPNVRARELPQTIYEAGIFLMAAKAVEFIRCIGNAGSIDDEPDEDDGGEEDSPLSRSETTTGNSLSEPQAG